VKKEAFYMKAFILAAGIGSRLSPITDEVPKCMVKVGDETIIERQLYSLKNAGVEEIFVCTGYLNEVLEDFIKQKYDSVKFIHNDKYLETNNMFSMYLTKNEAYNEDVIVMNADVFVDPEYIKKLVESPIENCILTEKDRYEEENMKIIVDSSHNIKSISKTVGLEESYGTTIDMYKFSKKFTIKWFEIMEDIIVKQNQKNMWNEVAINEMFQYEDVKPLEIGNMWFEIDTYEDLEKARELFHK